MADIIAIASGKGGVGKSFFSANLSMSFHKAGVKVLLVDGDLGGANLHNFVGLKAPGTGLYQFLKDKLQVQDVILNTPSGVDFIGGSGDVLTGIIVSLLGQGIPAFDASIIAAFIHGLAGDMEKEAKGEISLTASDLLSSLPKAFQQYGRSIFRPREK